MSLGYAVKSHAMQLCLLRAIHFTGAHTDWGFITFVDTNNTPGRFLASDIGEEQTILD